MIRCLRCGNYSLESILRLLGQLSQNPETDLRAALDTPRPTDEIISVCDRLISSLQAVELAIYCLYCALSLLTLFFAGALFWKIRIHGSLPLFLRSWLLTMISTLSIGLLVGGVAKNTKAASVIACILYFPMLLFSGATIPFEVMPQTAQRLVRLFPLTQGMQLMKAVFLGSEMENASISVWVMTGTGFLCVLISVKFFQWE